MFEVVIGLEVHIQLNTNTKLFCNCSTSFGDSPNKNTCPVCLGLPGSLPKTNKEAFIKAMKFGNAINATINDNSVFERKNYFYPDLPNGYQISQLEIPIVEKGYLIINDKNNNEKKIRINRAHLETDAGKSIHKKDISLIDLNRTGTPLLEIVTEPDFRNSIEVDNYLKDLQTLVRYLEISDANQQEGSFRCDVNISIRPKGDEKLYTRVEIKNMNSFKFIQQAIKYEVQRQIDAWEDGVYEKDIYQETRLFDTEKGITKSMRGKEEASDYRYFPDPDLLPVKLTEEMLKKGKELPELPKEKYNRFVNDLKLKPKDAKRIIADIELCELFEHFEISNEFEPSLIITWIVVEYMGKIQSKEYSQRTSSITVLDMTDIMFFVRDNLISGKSGKKILDYIINERTNQNESIENIIEKLNLKQDNDDNELEEIINNLLNNHKDKVEEYKNGKTKLLAFFVGQIMKETKGKANPEIVSNKLKEKLK